MHNGDMDTTTQTTTLTLDGMTVEVSIQRTDDGPLVTLGGVNCHLEGEMPGEYYLKPLEQPAQA
jgi:hypothetical protein